jgi:hypothetical protein
MAIRHITEAVLFIMVFLSHHTFAPSVANMAQGQSPVFCRRRPANSPRADANFKLAKTRTGG